MSVHFYWQIKRALIFVLKFIEFSTRKQIQIICFKYQKYYMRYKKQPLIASFDFLHKKCFFFASSPAITLLMFSLIPVSFRLILNSLHRMIVLERFCVSLFTKKSIFSHLNHELINKTFSMFSMTQIGIKRYQKNLSLHLLKLIMQIQKKCN